MGNRMKDHHMVDPRRASQVARFHTWPCVRRQLIDAHSYQVLRVLLAIWPGAPRRLLLHCVTHDLGEMATGDLPFPVKRDNPDLKSTTSRLEKSYHLSMCNPWGLPPPVELTGEETTAFKLAEFIEMMEYGLEELNMGNRYAQLVVSRCRSAIEKMLVDLMQSIGRNDEPDPQFDEWATNLIERVRYYVERRTKVEQEIHDATA
jgi:hypothetical protein